MRGTNIVLSCGCYMHTRMSVIPRVSWCGECKRKVFWSALPRDQGTRRSVMALSMTMRERMEQRRERG